MPEINWYILGYLLVEVVKILSLTLCTGFKSL